MSEPTNCKVVVLINRNLEIGVALNAVAHLSLGFASALGEADRAALKFLDYVDADGESHPHISARSLIVLKGTDGNLRTLRREAKTAGLPVVDFTETMTGGTYIEQLDRSRQTPEAELRYYAVMTFGTADQLAPLTRKYSLYR